MQSFIKQVVKEILSKNLKLENQVIVVPSQRSIVLIKNELSKQISTNSWLPKITTLDQLYTEISSLKLVSNVELIFKFYSSYLKIKKASTSKEIEDFESVSKWATIALSDFDELDRYLIDTKDFFNNFRDIKSIEQWSPNLGESLAEKYLDFWFDLEPIYNNFKRDLLSEASAYGGLALRQACEKIDDYISELKDEKHFNFVGFNALSKGEIHLLNKFSEANISSTFWDVDKYYMEDNVQEAGLFLRRHFKDLKNLKQDNFKWIREDFKEEKNIKIIGSASKVGQSRLSGQILSHLQKEGKISDDNINTALVLADESLLLPSLNSIPDVITNVNVTMGYPLYLSSFSSLFENFIHMHERFQTAKGFYYKDLLLLLKNPIFSNISDDFKDEIQLLINAIIKENKVYVNNDYINSKSKNPLIQSIFQSWNENSKVAIVQIINLIHVLKKFYTLDYDKNKLELDQLFKFSKIFNQIQLLSNKYEFFENLKSLKTLYKQILSMDKFSFIGEPLNGLQIMGVLETRLMDFENVIITSVNEGVLPVGSYPNTFMPYDEKLGFGLPSNKEKDAIYSYHFYRLIQRAKNIYLIYNNESKGLTSSESSRYIKQLIHENLENHKIEELIYTGSEFNLKSTNTIVEKDDYYRSELEHYAFKQGFSPSSLSNYLYNPLDFYFQKILHLKEEEEVEETADFRTFGNAIHDSLEIIYTPFIGKKLKVNDLELSKSEIEKLLKESFEKIYKNGDLTRGRNNLMFNVAVEFIYSFLNYEKLEIKRGSQIEIISLEKEYEVSLFIPQLGKDVKIKGKIDRVDRLDGQLRILDYKTGKADSSSLSINKSFEEIFNIDKPKTKLLQVMIYSMFAYRSKEINLSKDEQITAGLIALKNSSNMILNAKISKREEITINDVENFENNLREMIWSIFNPELKIEEKITETYD